MHYQAKLLWLTTGGDWSEEHSAEEVELDTQFAKSDYFQNGISHGWVLFKFSAAD